MHACIYFLQVSILPCEWRQVSIILNTYCDVLIRMKKAKHDLKAKLTLTVDEKVLDEAKKTAAEKHVPLSGVVENFLKFFTKPWVYCFKCGEKFDVGKSELCPKCGWLKCPKCGICRCGLDEDNAITIFHMRRVYEDLLTGRVK